MIINKVCSKCNIEKPLSEFYKQVSCKLGVRPDCKKCLNKTKKQYNLDNEADIKVKKRLYYENNRDRILAKERTAEVKFQKLQAFAKRKKYKFNLSFQDYIDLTIKNTCYYCNGKLPEAGYGLDRIDNKQGYVKENVRACCRSCNIAKNKLTEESFFNLVKLVYDKHIKGTDPL